MNVNLEKKKLKSLIIKPKFKNVSYIFRNSSISMTSLFMAELNTALHINRKIKIRCKSKKFMLMGYTGSIAFGLMFFLSTRNVSKYAFVYEPRRFCQYLPA